MSGYSVTEARRKFSDVLRKAETEGAVTITRRGRPVAVLLSIEEYRRLQSKESFWEAYTRLRRDMEEAGVTIEEDVFAGVRDRAPGRNTILT